MSKATIRGTTSRPGCTATSTPGRPRGSWCSSAGRCANASESSPLRSLPCWSPRPPRLWRSSSPWRAESSILPVDLALRSLCRQATSPKSAITRFGSQSSPRLRRRRHPPRSADLCRPSATTVPLNSSPLRTSGTGDQEPRCAWPNQVARPPQSVGCPSRRRCLSRHRCLSRGRCPSGDDRHRQAAKRIDGPPRPSERLVDGIFQSSDGGRRACLCEPRRAPRRRRPSGGHGLDWARSIATPPPTSSTSDTGGHTKS